jgi:MHS family proline/betaine transporter-like MFS transporter
VIRGSTRAVQEYVGTRAVLAAAIGNLLEWFDFSVFALFAIYIAENFFPAANPTTNILRAFLVFGLGFVVRPLGAVLLGVHGDRAGRKSALTLTLLLMAAGTLVIAAAPTYATAGAAAPLVLVAGRVLQGFSAGGEFASAATFLVEHAPDADRGRVAAWLQASMGMSNVLSAVVGFGVTTLLSPAQILSWGWRIPFLIGLLIAPCGLYLRRSLAETPQFSAAQALYSANQGVRTPLVMVFQRHWRALLLGIGICVLYAVAVYVLLIFMPVFLQRSLHFTARQSFAGSIAENIAFVAGCFAFGIVADRIRPPRMLAIGAIWLGVAVLPLFFWLNATHDPVALLFALSTIGISVSAFTGIAPTVLASLFPVAVRTSGVSLAYNSAITVFGGFAPAVLTWLSAQGLGSSFAPALFVVVAALPAVFAACWLNRRVPASLAGDRPLQEI